MMHANVSVEIHQHVNILIGMIHIHASVSVSHTSAILTNTLTQRPAVVVVTNIQPVLTTNTSMIHHVDAIAAMSRNVAQGNTMTMIHVNASVVTLQLVTVLMNMTHIHVSVSADHMTATQVSTLTLRAVVVSVINT